MVDVVGLAYAAVEVDQIADGSDDILEDDVLRAQLFFPGCDARSELVFIAVCLLDDVLEDRVEDLLGQSVRCEVDVDILRRIYEVVSDDLSDLALFVLVLAVNENRLNACILDDHCHRS